MSGAVACDEETWEDDPYAGVWRRVDSERLALSEKRRAEAGQLFAELTQSPVEGQMARLQEERFQTLGLLERLLEACHESQPADPAQAERLSLLAAELALRLMAEEPEATAALTRASCLGANARRLGGNLQGADALLARAAVFVDFAGERALLCRTAALVRWELGRIDEADALLQHAARLFRREGCGDEEGACQALLGLLHYEERSLGDPLRFLVPGWKAMGRAVRPLLAVRTGLALVACRAERGELQIARGLLREVWPLLSAVTDEAERTRVYACEGRALGRLGDTEEALQILESVRRKLLEEARPAEAALVCVDLALILAESGREDEIEALGDSLKAGSPAEPALAKVASWIVCLADTAASHEPTFQAATQELSSALRRAFRGRGLGLRPLPFV